MAPKTYTNEHGEKMHMKFRQILTIDHDDIGMVYHMPDGKCYTLSEKPILFQGEEMRHPETDEPLMIPSYDAVILSPEEFSIIKQHIYKEE